MQTYFFDVIVDRDLVNEEDSDRIFEVFEGDVSPAVLAGVPRLSCSIEAETLDAAIRRVLAAVPSFDTTALRVEVEPRDFAEAA